MNTKEALFETAKQLMALQQVFKQQVAALRIDPEVAPAEAHWLVDEAVDIAGRVISNIKEENKEFLVEMAEKGTYTYEEQCIAGVKVEGKVYSTSPVKGYELLNKDDPKVWAHVLGAAAKHCPGVIQQRITDSRVTEAFLSECAGLVALKNSDAFTWSIKKLK